MSLSAPDPALRPQILDFYAALRRNDVAALDEFATQGFPLAWVQAFAETSLPEYAMRHGAVEGAWWLMAKGVMPERWSEFSGDAWKTFLKKGFNLAISRQGPSIPMDVYKNILKVGLKTTGEKLPSWLDQYTTTATTLAGGLLDRVSGRFSELLRAAAERQAQAEQALERQASEMQASELDGESDQEPALETQSAPEPLSASQVQAKARRPVAKKAAKKTKSPRA